MVDRHRSTGKPALPVHASAVDPAGLGAWCVESGGAPTSPTEEPTGVRTFEEFFRNNFHDVRSWALADLGPRYQSDVDDIISEVMLAALQRAESRGGFDDPDAVPEPWLRAVTRNKTVDHLRRAWRNPMPASHEELRHLLLADNHGEVEAIAVQDLLVRMMQDLSLRQREILSRWISGYTVKEIAVMLGYTSDKAVHQHLRRARQVIRDRMSTGVDKV